MKFCISLILIILCIQSAWAKPVQPGRAQAVAENFYRTRTAAHQTRSASPVVNLVYTKRSASKNPRARTSAEALYYVFAFGEQGFIILSADDAAYPILGYSFSNNYVVGEEPAHLAGWMKQYEEQIIEIKRTATAATPEIAAQWEVATDSQFRTQGQVQPLLTTRWNQHPYYNAQCPFDADSGERTVTGCVATAMAQLMKYHHHPTQGVGFHSYNHKEYGTLSANFGSTTYDWEDMPFAVEAPNASVALLNYHCGVSVDMNYNVADEGGSSAQGAVLVAPVLKRHFSYASSTTAIYREDYTDQAWKDLLKAEIDAARPMFYEGSGAGSGHAFVCDGYDNNDFFHFNWGWGGYYDGYFHIDALNPSGQGTGGGTGHYNSNHAAIVGIAPAESLPVKLQLYAATTVSNGKITYAQPFGTFVNLANYGTETFVGDLTVALFDDKDNFITYIDTLENVFIAPGKNINQTFASGGLVEAYPGNYQLVVYYRVAEGDWISATAGAFENPSAVRVSGPDNDIKMQTGIQTTPKLIVQHEPFEVSFNVANYNQEHTYYGDLGVALYDLEGKLVVSLDEQSIGISPLSYNNNGYTFSSSGIDAVPGTYLWVVFNRPEGGIWQMVSDDYYPNPTRVTITAPPLPADPYEDNNIEPDASPLALSFTENQAVVRTVQANLHTGTDYDYYQITLPQGFSYTIEAKVYEDLQDNYPTDVLLSYQTDSTWSDAFDTQLKEPIALDSGGTVLFWIAPFFVGNTGTYDLEIKINREEHQSPEPTIVVVEDTVDTTVNNPVTGLNNTPRQVIRVYPNPAFDELKVAMPTGYALVNKFIIRDARGKQMQVVSQRLDGNVIIDVAHYPVGVYHLQWLDQNGDAYNRRFLVQ